MSRLVSVARSSSRSGVVVLKTGAETRAFADGVARSLLGIDSRQAFAKLDRGELTGTAAETELRMLQDFIANKSP